MGTIQRLLYWCAICIVLLLFCHNAGFQVNAESEFDSDLTFDSTDSSHSSPSVEKHQHWLSYTVDRLKRSISNLFYKDSDSPNGRYRRSPQEQNQFGGQQEAAEDYDDKTEDHYDEGDDENDIDESNAIDPRSWNNSVRGIFSRHEGYDDEDLNDPYSGSGTSTLSPPFHSNHPLYIRFDMLILEPYQNDLHDRNSDEFRILAERVKRSVESLYDSVPGTQTATVINFGKHSNDNFKMHVTFDLLSSDNPNAQEMIEVLRSHIESSHRVGDLTTSPEDFKSSIFEVNQVCDTSAYLQCRNDQCVPLNARCNGIEECSDGSDEVWCDAEPVLTTPSTNINREDFDGSGDDETTRSRNDNCRGDEVVRCTDNSRDICEVNLCDGTKDCDDGGDEMNCTTDCATGEFSCDLKRCLPISKRCDGTPDCEDKTDEQECLCTEDQFLCDQTRCISNEKRCDRRQDCNDGTDEANCPGPDYCGPRRFHCGDGQCIDESQRCNNIRECSNGQDEDNCPYAQCKEDEFYCGKETDDYCIPKSHVCNKECNCIRSCNDERNCPCRPEDFRCQNGHCIKPEQRCDGITNCQDGSDETGCRNLKMCEPYQWRCTDGTCIDKILKCNQKLDCPDHSDEQDCDVCREGYRCNNGTCLNADKRCDGNADCGFGEDEDGCVICPEGHFMCRNGDCIPENGLCNGFKDCKDGSDEINCHSDKPLICMKNSRRCKHDKMCIDENKFCDGVVDCRDGSDEFECDVAAGFTVPINISRGPPTNHCAENEFQCAAGFCIMGYKRCNGFTDCPSGNDEENCPTTTPPPTISEQWCSVNEFRCNNGFCVERTFRCDGIPDCDDKSDEGDCEAFVEDRCELRCRNGECVKGKLCDNIIDCLDGYDEENCGSCQFKFRCSSGECVEEHLRCDGTADCRDGSDESSCAGCPDDKFKCSNGLCLDIERRCDSYDDCPDGSDEVNCDNTHSSCRENEFLCDGICRSDTIRCDGSPQCNDGADEANCECRPNEFQCESGRCIPEYLRCNGKSECDDGSDEIACVSRCRSNEFTCGDGTCISLSNQCNGYSDCPDGSDEEECSACRDNQFLCLNGKCIDSRYRCNKRNDCGDNSDEHNCPTERPYVTEPPRPPIRCRYGQQRCRTGNQCIYPSQVCDGQVDCIDLSDESNCAVNKACSYGQFRCENGPCINNDLRCNGIVDCPFDTSDELDCSRYFRASNWPSYANNNQLNLKTYPSSQEIKENVYKPDREVVFQCRDEGPLRARVHWIRPNGVSLPPGSRDHNGRLEIPNIKVEHSGAYICEAIGYPSSTPGAQVSVNLHVDRSDPPTPRPPSACQLHEATCSNGECISKHLVCDGRYDCTDGSDEVRCNPNGCEPNEFRCANKKCVLKTWRCDADDDCGDGSDEDNCGTTAPDSICQYHQFTCRSRNQCIPKSFHCDLERDCMDGSDEVGCSKPIIMTPPPPRVTLDVGALFEISCTAVGVPAPEIVWRLNWGHVPPKCRSTSENGVGRLSCPDIQIEDQGAYSCEAINIKGTTFAVPDTILIVNQRTVCPVGYFNSEARSPDECIKCFCFGHTATCHSADLYTYQFQPPFDTLKLLGVKVDVRSGTVEIRDEPIYRGVHPQLTQVGGNGVHSSLPYGAEVDQPNLVPYFAMPENYHGNQLKSYGGYLRYNVLHTNRGIQTPGPDVVLSGNGYTLLHQSRFSPLPYTSHNMSVRFFVGEWVRRSSNGPENLATREEIMMALANIENILIKLQYNEGILNTTLSNIEMDSAATPNSNLGAASYVEECSCPVGYSGYSCERCASGYSLHKSGPWLGQCYKEQRPCPSGTYSEGGECHICPCPSTSPSNQFGRTCSRHPDGEVVCDCPPGYVGRRCEACATGYTGNPLAGEQCVIIESQCGEGALTTNEGGQCLCKQYTTGPSCDVCKANTFYLSSKNQFGCIACFCMGITQQCSSSNWYRDQVTAVFTSSTNDFKLIDPTDQEPPLSDIQLNPDSREIYYNNFPPSKVYYWSVPSRYLGNKVTSYGGYLKYTLRNTPVPGGQSSRNSAADVELVSKNNIRLLYFSNRSQPINVGQQFVVPLFEQYWQRQDGQSADREHLLMTLADLEAINIKATYYTNTREASLNSVSLDIASERNTGSEDRALEVEQCQCPPGYKGLSCEDCDFGYTRSLGGIYLGTCQPCECNGHSNECHPETGECFNCRDFTTGENCEECLRGYDGDPTKGIPCRYIGNPSDCHCHPSGSISNECYNGVCSCRLNVEGRDCDRCKQGAFGLNASNIYGCDLCFCSGVAKECSEGDFYVEQIPYQILDETEFSLTDQSLRTRIKDRLDINPSMNEIRYAFLPSNSDRLFWSLPQKFTGNYIMSYGGKLEFIQRYTQRPQAQYVPDDDIIISGNDVTIYWSNPTEQPPNIANKVSVPLHPSANWHRRDQNRETKPASREDILTVLANIDWILVRAAQSSDTANAYLSDITLDTAVEQYTGLGKATGVEICNCPEGYRGSSCELCAPGYYRDSYIDDSKPLGSCTRCPCQNADGCSLGPDRRVICHCRPGTTGRDCTVYPTPRPPPHSGTAPPPTIEIVIVTPEIEIFEVGSTVRYNCSARSRLAPTSVRVQWSKDGGELSQYAVDDGSGILIITNLQVSDSGRYICEADDGYSVATSIVNLNVGQPRPEIPRIVITPTYLDLYERQSAEIRCTADGLPPPSIQLNRADGQQLSPYHSFENGVFKITQVSRSDAGRYECVASNSAGTDVASFQIDVRQTAAPIVRVDIEPPSFNGVSDETVRLRCVTRDSIESIRWSKEDGQLPYNSREENGVLEIQRARPEDSGVYVCTVTSYSGTSGSQRATVSITESNQGKYPVVKVFPERVTISQGNAVELQCEVSGSPIPTIKWTKVGEEFRSNVEQVGSVLYIKNAQVADRGMYVCVATNSYGIQQASGVVEVTRLEVPVLNIHPSNSQVVVAGGGAILQCRAIAGIPSPTITWTRGQGQSLTQNIEEMSDGVLRFTSITPLEAGEYICTAVNEAGRATAVANIVVHTPPDVWITPAEETITRNINDKLRLECKGSGTPSPSVVWTKYPSTSRSQTPLFGLPSRDNSIAVQEFNRLTKEDEGIYICKAQSSAGVLEKRVRLIVDSFPERGDITGRFGTGEDATSGSGYKNISPPKEIDEHFTAPVGTRAELRCSTNDDSQQIRVDWVRSDNSSLPPNAYIRGGTLYINDVQPSAAGVYRCLGYHQSNNALVFSFNSYLEVISPPRISLRPQKQTVHPGDNAYIECLATGEQPISINWSPVNRAFPTSVETRDGFIRFNNIQLRDAGRYRCSARNTAGEADAVAEVLVEENVYKPQITADNRNQSAPIGSRVTLHCRARNEQGSRNIHWSREGRPLPSNSSSNGEYLYIYYLQPGDEGRYFCEVNTEEGSSSDYVDLHVYSNRRFCQSGEYSCTNHNCIPLSRYCDDIDDCGDNSDEDPRRCSYRTRRREPSVIDVVPHTGYSLRFEPPSGTLFREGDNVEIACQENERGAITTWMKKHSSLPNNAQTSGNFLRFRNIRMDNTGVYVCEASGRDGVYSEEYILNVQERPGESQIPIQVKRAARGASVQLECQTNLQEPVTYKWSKQGGRLRDNIDVNAKTIQLNNVEQNDASTYVCHAENNRGSNLRVPIILLVTGIVPYFNQGPNSYISLHTIHDHYLQFTFEISFKPENGHGLILFNNNMDKQDFISLALIHGVPQFSFNLGSATTTVKADYPVTNREWHTIKVTRVRRDVTMQVDGKDSYTATSKEKLMGIDLSDNLYLGGVPDYNELPPDVGVYNGFVGCISRFKVNRGFVDLMKDATSKNGITNCEACSENKCENQAACQESLTKEGYYCICPLGYSGPTCRNIKAESCTPDICGSGRCIEVDDTYQCQCPIGWAGKNCEREVIVNEPAFKNDAFIAYQPPKLQRRMHISLKMKPKDQSDGILLYSGEEEDGDGNFISLAIRDKHLEFSFDYGNGPTVIRHPKEIEPGQWIIVTALKSLNVGRLIVHGSAPISGKSPGSSRALNLNTPLYIGGYDRHRITINRNVKVTNSFSGCISDVKIPSITSSFLENISESSNVEDCSEDDDVDNNIYSPGSEHTTYNPRKTGCSGNPCKNNGLCYPLSPIDYRCSCESGFSGRNCETLVNLCEERPCRNGGTCVSNTTSFTCNCPLRFTGARCEQATELRNDVHFDGNGYLEFPKTLLNHDDNELESDVIALEFSTNSSDGLIFWHGQTPTEDGQGQDYIALALENGYLEFSFDLGSGPAIIQNRAISVNDGQRHSVILKREGKVGSIEIDHENEREGETPGLTSTLNTNGNIYLGGTPNISLMSSGRFTQGFNGCIHGFELQTSKSLDMGMKAVSGLNVKPCSSFFPPSDISNNILTNK